MNTEFNTIDEYIASCPKEHQAKLEELRIIIRNIAPEAVEVKTYGMPGFKYKGKQLAAFALTKNHYGFYPMSGETIEKHKNDIKEFETTKGSVHFPFDKPLPVLLIQKLILYRIQKIQDLERK